MGQDGFFSEESLRCSDPRVGMLPKCGQCKLNVQPDLHSPKMPLYGQGCKHIMILGEAPGKDEDADGHPFVGPSGNLLRAFVSGHGVDLDADCWRANAVNCRPIREDGENKKPTLKQIESCRPLTLKYINDVSPHVLILLGESAIKSIIDHLWGEASGSVSRWAGWTIPYQPWNMWICPTWHPAFVMRGGKYDRGESEGEIYNYQDSHEETASHVWVRRHLGRAIQLSFSRPWKDRPKYLINIEMNPRHAVSYIKDHFFEKGPVAFDYETNCLKPEINGAEIVCCAICFGDEQTIAFPWTAKTADATRRLLHSQRPKIAANMKFEERWTSHVFGEGVRRWSWDTMLASHVIDCRTGITSLKFQAFVQFGLPPYDRHISPYLEQAGENRLNRIRQLNLRDLLRYNGMDALLAYRLAMIQRKVVNEGTCSNYKGCL